MLIRISFHIFLFSEGTVGICHQQLLMRETGNYFHFLLGVLLVVALTLRKLLFKFFLTKWSLMDWPF